MCLDDVLKTEIKNKFVQNSTILRKHRVQLAQRVGLIFLKPRITKWRYQRGFRSLEDNIKIGYGKEVQAAEKKKEEVEEEDDMDNDFDNDMLEYIINYLLTHLKDTDTIVRWNAAKGIGRITGRLTQEFADQIVEELLELF
jgi:hypothetical protein